MLATRLKQPQRISNLAIAAADILPLQSSGVRNSQLAETVLLGVQHGSDVSEALARTELRVTLNITSHTVDNVSDRLPGVGTVCILVEDRAAVEGAVTAHGPHTLVPVDVAGEIGINAMFQEQLFECVTEMHHVGGVGGRVHGAMAHDENPGGLLAVDAFQVLL